MLGPGSLLPITNAQASVWNLDAAPVVPSSIHYEHFCICDSCDESSDVAGVADVRVNISLDELVPAVPLSQSAFILSLNAFNAPLKCGLVLAPFVEEAPTVCDDSVVCVEAVAASAFFPAPVCGDVVVFRWCSRML